MRRFNQSNFAAAFWSLFEPRPKPQNPEVCITACAGRKRLKKCYIICIVLRCSADQTRASQREQGCFWRIAHSLLSARFRDPCCSCTHLIYCTSSDISAILQLLLRRSRKFRTEIVSRSPRPLRLARVDSRILRGVQHCAQPDAARGLAQDLQIRAPLRRKSARPTLCGLLRLRVRVAPPSRLVPACIR